MRISRPTHRMVEIGPLDACLRLPTESRVRHGMKTICVACREPVTESTFIAGFLHGMPNMILHERCIPYDDPGLLALRSKEAANG